MRKDFNLPLRVEHIFFDIDNTLYTCSPYAEHQYEVLYRQLALSLGREYLPLREEVELWRNNKLEQNGKKPSLASSFERYSIPISKSILWRSENIVPEKYLTADTRLSTSLEQLADSISGCLCAVTNNPAEIGRRTLSVLGVEKYFSAIVGLDTAGASKPDSRHFHIGLELTGANPHTSISVGDRYSVDLEPAMALGMGGMLVETVEDTYTIPAFILAPVRTGAGESK